MGGRLGKVRQPGGRGRKVGKRKRERRRRRRRKRKRRRTSDNQHGA